MISGAVLEDIQDYSISNQKQLKVSFLQKEKQRFQQLVSELQNNNNVMRDVIKEMANEQKLSIETLLKQNKKLQDQKLCLFEKNQKAIAQGFLFEQVMLENENESRQMLKNYEEKIIELRRLVQMKEGAIQQFQNKKKLLQNMEQILIPPYNVSMHFYSQFQQYKKTISSYVENHKFLKKENQKLKAQNETLNIKCQKLQEIASSKCSFLEYRNLANKDRHHSLPRKDVQVQVAKKISLKKVQESFKNYGQKTRDVSLYEQSNKINTVKRILKKQMMENQSLKEKLRNLKKTSSQEKQKSKQLIESNKFYLKHHQNVMNQMNYFKNMAKNLSQTFLQRRKFPRSSSVQRADNTKIFEIKKAVLQKNDFKRKNFWAKVKEEVDIKCNRPILLFIGDRKGRSLSSTVDYTKREYEITSQVLEVPNFKKKKNSYVQQKKKEGESNLFFDDISIIGGNKKMTYSDIKKQKEKGRKKGKEEQQFDNILNDSLFG